MKWILPYERAFKSGFLLTSSFNLCIMGSQNKQKLQIFEKKFFYDEASNNFFSL